MERSHLTDIELQNCAEHGFRRLGTEARRHIRSCAECMEKVNEYSLLFEALECEPEPILSSNFASKTVDSLRLVRRESFIERYTAELVGAFGLLAAIAAVLFIFDPIHLLVTATQAISSMQTALDLKMTSASQFVIKNRGLTLVLFGLSTVLAIWIVDRLFRRRKVLNSIFVA